MKWGAIGAVILGAVGGVFAWSGLYNVSAARSHWGLVEWLLAFVMQNSVRTHALGIEPPADLGTPDRVVLGAAHFHSGCAFCHGAPGVPTDPVTQAMLPAPPDLGPLMADWEDGELFWIVKEGVKYTGMPSWPARARDDEVWAVVAFLRQLPSLDADGYHRLALGGLANEPRSGGDIVSGIGGATGGACARCHGDPEHVPTSALVPILHGQSDGYLAAALRAYASGERQSGIMQHQASALAPEEIERLAKYYAGLAQPLRPSHPTPFNQAAGRAIAEEGIAEAEIPACRSCHRRDALPLYPLLDGQNAPYMAGQLRLWRSANPGTDAAAIMAPIARRLSDARIDAVAAYFASLPPMAGQ